MIAFKWFHVNIYIILMFYGIKANERYKKCRNIQKYIKIATLLNKINTYIDNICSYNYNCK